MRIAFLGTPDVGAHVLRDLVAAGHDVAIVVSQPDRKRGRGSATSPSPVKAAALELGLPVTDNVDDVLSANVELGIVVAFGQLIKPHVLSAVKMINIHFSLLPRWRGAAPVERAILAGDTETGVCIMEVVDQLDAGDVYAEAVVQIDNKITADDLRTQLTEVGSALLLQILDRGLGEPIPQIGEVEYAKKIKPSELQLNLNHPAESVLRTIRIGGAWTTFHGKRLRIIAASVADIDSLLPGQFEGDVVGCGKNTSLMLRAVQPESKKQMDAAAWLAGARPTSDDRLGS